MLGDQPLRERVERGQADGGRAAGDVYAGIPFGGKTGRSGIFPGNIQYIRRKPCGNLCRQRHDDKCGQSSQICKYQHTILERAFFVLREDQLKVMSGDKEV